MGMSLNILSPSRFRRLVAVCSLLTTPVSALDIGKIRKSVFEIVLKKPVKDTLTYAEKLPVENLAYADRMDPYYSIGSAFAIDESRLITAWHVLDLGSGGLNTRLYLRDQNGKIHELDQIIGFSNRQDYAIFTVKNGRFKNFLRPANKVKLNEKVYAVGNAHGEGIISRDGVFTSETPEVINGAWKWIRFSAAVSPGNSGGPLLNKKGEILGVISRKSENENLNYAVPAKLFMQDKTLNKLQYRYTYKFYNSILATTYNHEKSYSVPRSYLALDAEIQKDQQAIGTKLQAKFFSEKKAGFFPNGAGANLILNSTYDNVFPLLIGQSDDGIWSVFEPEKKEEVVTPRGGTITYGSMRGVYFQLAKLPAGESVLEYIRNPRKHMDFILNYVHIDREMAGQKIKITSLGEPARKETHTDIFGRRWQVSEFEIDYANEVMLVYSTPTPEGIISLAIRNSASVVRNDLAFDLKKLVDYVLFSHYGQFSAWKTFLSMRDYIPQGYDSLKFQYVAGQKLEIEHPEYTLQLSHDKFKISDTSDLRIDFSLSHRGDTLRLDLSDMQIGEDVKNSTVTQIYRMAEPRGELPESFMTAWENLKAGRDPYDLQMRVAENRPHIQKPVTHLSGKSADGRTFRYSIRFVYDGKINEGELLKKLEYVEQGIRPKPSP